MNARDQLQDLPRALGENLEGNRADYERLIRARPWGQGPIYLLASGSAWATAWSGRYAFEDLLGCPTLAREPRDFNAYALSALGPGAVVMPVGLGDEPPELLEAAEAAKKRGARVLALSDRPSGSLAGLADGVFIVRVSSDAGPPSLQAAVCGHVAMRQVAVIAARALKRPRPEHERLDRELAELPRHLEWMHQQLRDGAKALGTALEACETVLMVGGGFYFPAALEAASMTRHLAGLHCPEPSAAQTLATIDSRVGALFLSGSHCRVRKQVYERAARLRVEGARIFSVTDGNDRGLVERSEFTALLPLQGEMAGSILALAFVLGMAAERERRKPGPTTAEGPRPVGRAAR